MRSGLFVFAWLLILGLVAQGCEDWGPDRSELLVSSAWKFSTAKGRTNTSETWQDLPLGTVTYQDCAKDDLHTFLESGGYNIVTGSSKCSQQQASTLNGNWVLERDDLDLVITVDGSTRKYAVTELSKSTLQTTVYLNPYYIQVTYTH